MVAIGHHAPAPVGHAVHGPREPRADRHHAAPEGVAVVRLDDEMGMVALQRVVHEPKVGTRAAGGEGPLDLADDAEGAERREIGPEPQRDVGGQHPEGLAGDVRSPARGPAGFRPAFFRRPPHPGVLAMGERVGELGESLGSDILIPRPLTLSGKNPDSSR